MKDRIKDHWNGRAKAYDENVRQVIYSSRDKMSWQKIFVESLGEKNLEVLDVGTGPGIVANLLADLGHDVTGIDPSDGMLKKAQENSEALGNSVELVRGDGETLPFEDESFDAVVNRYVLWTLPDPKRALLEWKRVLKPGGLLVIVDGTWYDKTSRTIKRKLWQMLSSLLILITERRVPCYRDLDEDLRKNLWSTSAKRPQADAEMLRSLGFKEIQIADGLNKRLMKNLDYLKNGYSGDRFLISGVK